MTAERYFADAANSIFEVYNELRPEQKEKVYNLVNAATLILRNISRELFEDADDI